MTREDAWLAWLIILDEMPPGPWSLFTQLGAIESLLYNTAYCEGSYIE